MTTQALRNTNPEEFQAIVASTEGAISQMVCGDKNWNAAFDVDIPMYGTEIKGANLDQAPKLEP